ncbi:hypothetical protein F5Y18DRAFT_159317 [Xylariaceae sp. FL1019]|nr:hypothetical protein F5Y18DRAFT_159317 [Xylariaceae sp. FL1019]
MMDPDSRTTKHVEVVSTIPSPSGGRCASVSSRFLQQGFFCPSSDVILAILATVWLSLALSSPLQIPYTIHDELVVLGYSRAQRTLSWDRALTPQCRRVGSSGSRKSTLDFAPSEIRIRTIFRQRPRYPLSRNHAVEAENSLCSPHLGLAAWSSHM